MTAFAPPSATSSTHPLPRAAAEAAHAHAAPQLGALLIRQRDIDRAQAAYERAEAAGDVRGSLKLAALLEDHRKDLDAAEAACRRADEAGDVNGSGHLARLLEEKGDLQGAEGAFRRAADRGSVRAGIHYAGIVSLRSDATATEVAEAAKLLCEAEDHHLLGDDETLMGASLVYSGLEERCDVAAIELGVRRADERGSAHGAYHLGVLCEHRDHAGSLRAFLRAEQRGCALRTPYLDAVFAPWPGEAPERVNLRRAAFGAHERYRRSGEVRCPDRPRSSPDPPPGDVLARHCHS